MGDKKNKKQSSGWRSIVVILVFFVSLLVVFFVWQYYKNRPNHRDLKKEFSNLQLPAEWKLVSESGNKGTLGLFCWKIGGEECPYIINEYSNEKKLTNSASALQELNNILANSSYKAEDNSYGLKCTDIDIKNNDYNCYVVGTKNNIVVSLSYSSQNPYGLRGNWSSVTMNSKTKL